MNIVFITMFDFRSIEESNIYADLMREFIKKGNIVNIICPTGGERNETTNFIDLGGGCGILRVKTDRFQKVNPIKKGIATLEIEAQFKNAVKKYFSNIKFDLVLYSTPPITLAGVVEYIKKRDNAKTYLLLKDIFPQNAVDIGMITRTGVKSIIYKIFRRREKQLYKLSDCIGCMSQANVDYVINNNPDIMPERVHICPNSIEIRQDLSNSNKAEIRSKYGIPLDKTVFVYGGNLGRPQGIPFIIECLKANEKYNDRFFVICGTGTEYPKLKKYVDEAAPENVLLINGLPQEEYESLVGSCDVGLIFLDHRFTIPNFPSRMLSYMQNGLPIIACTDTSTDIGKVIVDGEFGWQCESDIPEHFTKTLEKAIKSDLKRIGKNGSDYLKNNYDVRDSFKIILNSINQIA